MNAGKPVALVTGWQVTASLCFYALFASTAVLSDAFALSGFAVGLLVTGATLGYTLALFPVGATVDALGEKPVMVGGLLALAAGAAGVGVAPSTPLLFAAAVCLGVAYATAMPATNRAIVASVPASYRGRAMGVKQVGVTAGSGLSALLVVGLAPQIATWHAGFFAAAAIAVVVAGLFTLAYDGSPGGDWALPDLGGLRANRAYVALVSAGLFLGAALFTLVGYTTLFLTDGVGASVALAGLGFAAMQVSGSLGRVVAGGLADRLDDGNHARASATVMLGQVGLGIGLLVVLATADLGVVAALVVVVLLGATVLGFTGLFYGCMTAIVPDDEVGAATAGGQTALNSGALVAPPAFGWLVDAASFGMGWSLLAGCVAVGTGLLAVVRRTVGRD
ncbi:MFS transporter [Haloarchaeobius sp. TZWWS8]|uniref:MFS transporter n=1 Tax=Haloarchaeobius sp. TZWWS8 TaxID=3446121 RepID=UPI003EB89C4E